MYYMLNRLDFGSKWIGWIRAYMESGSISMLVYDNPTQKIRPTRGLSKGPNNTIFVPYCGRGPN